MFCIFALFWSNKSRTRSQFQHQPCKPSQDLSSSGSFEQGYECGPGKANMVECPRFIMKPWIHKTLNIWKYLKHLSGKVPRSNDSAPAAVFSTLPGCWWSELLDRSLPALWSASISHLDSFDLPATCGLWSLKLILGMGNAWLSWLKSCQSLTILNIKPQRLLVHLV